MEELNTGIGLNKSLKEIFDSSRVSIHKWENYFAIYESYFDKRNKRAMDL